MADVSKTAQAQRQESNTALHGASAGQNASQRWLREFRMPAASDDRETATAPMRRHIDEYA